MPQACRNTIVMSMILSLLFLSAASQAETKPIVTDVGVGEPRSFLFVGNSFMYYNNSMHKKFIRVARGADVENESAYRATSVTISGSGLKWHDMQSYLRPDALVQYSFFGDNEVRFNDFDQLFDVVIMMDCSQCPVNPKLVDTFHEYAEKHSKTIIEQGTRPVLLMTWAYEDRPDMTAALAEQYTIAGNNNQILVIPAGLAFARAREQQPDIELYQPDKRHPSLLGTYLAALTSYAAIYKQSPVGGKAINGVPAETATFLQQVAWETVQDYYPQQ